MHEVTETFRMFVFRVLNTVPYSNRSGAKDLVAALHAFITTNMLIGLAILISWKQFGGTPIECMVPTDFTSAWVQYANNYCWAQPTYFIPFTESLVAKEHVSDGDGVEGMTFHDPESGAKVRIVKKGGEKISYYQWMPFFLLFEAICFRLPCYIWKYFASQSGMQVGEILRVASDENNAVPEVKRANINALCIHLQGVLRFQKRLKLKNIVPHKVLRFLNLKYSMYYVTTVYFFAKMAFLANSFFQISLLNKYVLPVKSRNNFGFDVWKLLIMSSGNQTWRENGLFPRSTLCDFEVREMGNTQTYTVQCVLLLNIMTEKIFIILWAWYLILISFTVCNLTSWLFAVFNDTYNEHFLINHLEMSEMPFDKENLKNHEHIERFMTKYMGVDGMFLLQMIAQHADVVFTTELIGALFKKHYEIEEQRRTLKQMNRVLPLLRGPEAANQVDVEASVQNSPSKNRRKSRQASLASSLRRFGSVEAPDGPTKKFDDSSSDEEDKTKSSKSSKKTSPKKTPATTKRASFAHPQEASLVTSMEMKDLPKTTEKRMW